MSVSFENIDIESKWDICVKLRRYLNCADIGMLSQFLYVVSCFFFVMNNKMGKFIGPVKIRSFY